MKKIKYLLIITLFLLTLFFVRPCYYWSIILDFFKKPISFEKFTNICVEYILRDWNNKSYTKILNSDLEFNQLIKNKYKINYYYWGFELIKVLDNCFVYEWNASYLEKTFWLNLNKFKRENYNTLQKCDLENCKIFITEKWLLKFWDTYICK